MAPKLPDPKYHLEKSADHDITGTWLVLVDGVLAGTVRPAWLRKYTRRHHWQGWTSIPVGRPCKTRKDAAVHVIDAYERTRRLR